MAQGAYSRTNQLRRISKFRPTASQATRASSSAPTRLPQRRFPDRRQSGPTMHELGCALSCGCKSAMYATEQTTSVCREMIEATRRSFRCGLRQPPSWRNPLGGSPLELNRESNHLHRRPCRHRLVHCRVFRPALSPSRDALVGLGSPGQYPGRTGASPDAARADSRGHSYALFRYEAGCYVLRAGDLVRRYPVLASIAYASVTGIVFAALRRFKARGS